MTKIRRLEPYGFNEQPQFNGLANTVKANIENIKEKNQEQDEKDVEQDANITQVTSTLTDSLNQKLGSGFTGDNSANTVTSVIEKNEKVVLAALNDLNDRKLDSSAYTKTDLSDYYKKEETSGKSEIDTALNAKANTVHTHSSSDLTDKVTEITASNSDSTSVPTVNAVMQLINAKLDINYTGFTGTTLTGVTTIIGAIQKIANKLDTLPNR